MCKTEEFFDRYGLLFDLFAENLLHKAQVSLTRTHAVEVVDATVKVTVSEVQRQTVRPVAAAAGSSAGGGELLRRITRSHAGRGSVRQRWLVQLMDR